MPTTLFFVGAVQFKLISGFSTGKAFEKSGKFASLAVEEVRTVTSLGAYIEYHCFPSFPNSQLSQQMCLLFLTIY